MILCEVLQKYRVSWLLLCVIWSLYEHRESCVCILGVKSKPLMVVADTTEGVSSILFVAYNT